MSSTPANAAKMRDDYLLLGPDFVVAEISRHAVNAQGAIVITLSDGTEWHMEAGNKFFHATEVLVTSAVTRKVPVLVSGERSSGRIERLITTQRLAPRSMTPELVDGELQVNFSRTMSTYYLRAARPWFAAARRLIRHELAQPITAEKPADLLLVSLDIVTQEIIDVRP